MCLFTLFDILAAMKESPFPYEGASYRSTPEEEAAGVARREKALRPQPYIKQFLEGEPVDSVRFQALSDAAEKRRLENHVRFFDITRLNGLSVNENDEGRDRRALRVTKRKVQKARKDPSYKDAFDAAIKEVIDPFQRGFVDYQSTLYSVTKEGRILLINQAIVTLQKDVASFQKPIFTGHPTDGRGSLPIVDIRSKSL